MMKPTTLASLSLLFLLLFVTSVESRKEILLDECPNKQKCEEKKNNKEFEARPSVTAYNNDNVHGMLKNNEFEPRPSMTAYNNDNIQSKLKNSGFEPRPSVTAYNNEFEPRPSVTTYNKEFEPIPSVTKYND
ncbi:hypothetical protein Ahy_B03g068122 [Arachis hypogaea]|uniref:Organ-specific protein S2 n=1 Tax=Arachis hypogaea TaxID=3818 RepID=A0A445A8V6_ARAHY|nr:hypothetical protein Ahy_B03g068122 [Arachis hypogaea]